MQSTEETAEIDRPVAPPRMHQGTLQGAVSISDEQGGEQNGVDNIAVEINMEEVGNSETTPGVCEKKVD